MRKTKVIYALMASAMLCIAVTGCGSEANETGEDYNIDIESTTTPAPTVSVHLGGVTDPDDVTPTTEPTATSTPTPTETPTPEPTATSTPVPTATSTPVPTETPVVQSDWFTENNIDILGAGDFTYEGSEWVEENGEYILKSCPGSGSVNFYVTDNGNGTTTYQAEFIVKGNRDDVDVAVADLYSGTIFKDAGYFGDPLLVSDPNVTLADGTKVEFAIERWSVQGWGYDEATGEEAVVEFNVNCCVTAPSEYDGLIFVLRCRDVNREYNPSLYFAD